MLRKNHIFLLLLCLSTQLGLNAQEYNNSFSDSTHKNLTIYQDKRLNKLLEDFSESKYEGFKIQIYSDSKKQPAKKIQADFIISYPEIKSELIYQQPFFKVRVGNFRTKLEAIKFKKEIESKFPNCFIVTDEIDFPEIKKN
ncbi:MAG: hypothetical protein Kow0079_02900 [Vicingaceae bacterium]